MSLRISIKKVVATCACVALITCGMTGCRASDALVEVIYDQTSSNIDYNNPTKYYINDPDSTESSDKVPAVEVDNSARETEEHQNLVVYGSDPNTKGLIAKQSLFNKLNDFTGIEASSGVSLYYSDSPDAIDHEVEKEEEEIPPEPDPVVVESNDGTSGSIGSGGTGGSGSGSESTDEAGEPESAPSDDGGGTRGEMNVVDPAGDPFADLPNYDSVAAFGDAAVLVEMVGGKGALAATDAATLASSGFSSVFDTSGIAQGWSDSGTAAGIDADAIIQSGAKTILCYSSAYQDEMSTEDLNKLAAAGVSLHILQSPTNTTAIINNVYDIGDRLAASTKAAKATSQGGIGTDKMAEKYEQFFYNLIDTCVNANGGLAGDDVYESNASRSYTLNPDSNYTLLMDGWDTSLDYVGTGSFNPQLNGAGTALTGVYGSPVSFYIQAGGLINTAAVKGDSGAHRVIVSQFSYNQLQMTASYWANASSYYFPISGSPWDRCLLTTDINNTATSAAYGASFMSDYFPVIIVGTQSAKLSLISNSQLSQGFYHPYSVVNDGLKTIGPTTSIYSCIGVGNDGKTSVAPGGSIASSNVEVNPSGLVSSWLGGSVESVLEAAWVAGYVSGNISTSSTDSYIVDFYDEFFDYSLSNADLNDILDGD